MDDDIVFLGTSKPKVPLPTIHPAVRPVTGPGITLYVEKNGLVPAHSLTFRRAATTAVHVGRRSASDTTGDDRTTNSDTAASFRCAVVSRRHAKIAFSDSGHAYLIDLGSHHGTHVRSPADRLSRALVPETPTLLVNGDLITFGKPVGKGDECVKPIVARVELVYDIPVPVLTNAADASVTNPSRPSTPSAVHTSSVSPVSPGRSSSGRYGIHIGISPFSSSSSSSSSSSDAEGESMEHDSFSDIEEIPPPASHSSSQLQAQSQSQLQSQSQPQAQQLQIQSQSQGQPVPSSGWSIHPAPPIPQILGRVASTLRFPQRNVPPRDPLLTPSWFTNRSQRELPEPYQPPQQLANESANEARDTSRSNEALLERRLRDALSRRRAQQQVQEGARSAAQTSTASVPPSANTDTASTPSLNISAEAPIKLGDLSPPTSATVPVAPNRLPSMTSLIERPLSHFGLSQLSQFFLGGLGTDKTKPSTSDAVGTHIDTTKMVSAEPSLPTDAEGEVIEQAQVGNSGPKDAVAVKETDALEGGNEAPFTTPPVEWGAYAPVSSTPLMQWSECSRPAAGPTSQYVTLPSLASALSPSHGNGHVHAHAHGHGQTAWMQTWYPPPPPPAPHVFPTTEPYHLPPPLPPTHSSATAGAWHWNDSWLEMYNATVGDSGLPAGKPEDQRPSEGHPLTPCDRRPSAGPYCAAGFPRFPLPSMDTASTDDVRGIAQSPPPVPCNAAPGSPGLSYASSRASSPALSDAEERRTESQKDREKSEPMDLASRSASPEPQQLVDKGKRRAFDFAFNLSQDEDDEDDDEGAERDMEVEAEAEANAASKSDGTPETKTGSLQLLTFMRDKAAAQEAQITREQEQERERERDRQDEWAAAVEKREAQRREMEREVRTAAELRHVQQAINKLEGDLNMLRAQANAKLAVHTGQLASFDGRIREVDAECGVLCVRVEALGERLEVVQIDVASVDAAMDNILDRGESGTGSGNGVGEDEDAMTDRDAVKVGVSELRAMIDEMKAIRESMKLQAEEELGALCTLRSEAEAAYAALTQQMLVQGQEAQVQTQPPVLPSLKRKRDDSDEDEAAPDGDDERDRESSSENANANEHETEHVLADDVVMDATSLPLATTSTSASSSGASFLLPPLPPTVEQATLAVRDARPPPRKRARTIARFVARTATAVGVGAVVTWTALAFS